MGEVANTDQATDVTGADEQIQPHQPKEPELFITLPFDEKLSFKSSLALLNWVKEDQKIFEIFCSSNLSYKDNSRAQKDAIRFPEDINGMYKRYTWWYDQAIDILEDICKLHGYSATITTPIILREKKEDLIRYWTEFTSEGLVPLQSSIGRCALAMSKASENMPTILPSALLASPKQGIAWLHAMTVLRKQQVEQKISAAHVAKEIFDSTVTLKSLNDSIEAAQRLVGKYRTELEEFQNNALKSAALKSPANALGKLELAHRKAAGWWFSLASIVAVGWFAFIYFYYFPDIIKPLLNDSKNLYAELGMGLTSLISAGIVTTSLVILLRLAIVRINFSVAAGERKTMAMAFRALLLKDAISEDQQMLFLQNIVGSKLPDFVNCNDIRIPIEELAKLAQAVPKGKKD